ncbi:MAG: enoyl-CoA hydratase/isomerase family protein [Microbacteriaceae bacterium]
MTEAPMIRTRVDGNVATVSFANGRHNAMTERMVVELHDALVQLAGDDRILVVVLTGEGRSFCPGADLAHVASGRIDAPIEPRHYRAAVVLHETPQVTVAAINGACAGAGLTLAAACDLRVASRSARFSVAFLDVGVAGDMGGAWTLPRLVGAGRARDLMFLPEKFDAQRALEVGLVSRVFDDDRFRDEVGALTTRLAAASPAAMATLKENLLAAERMGFADYVDLETERHTRRMASPGGRSRFSARGGSS